MCYAPLVAFAASRRRRRRRWRGSPYRLPHHDRSIQWSVHDDLSARRGALWHGHTKLRAARRGGYERRPRCRTVRHDHGALLRGRRLERGQLHVECCNLRLHLDDLLVGFVSHGRYRSHVASQCKLECFATPFILDLRYVGLVNLLFGADGRSVGTFGDRGGRVVRCL